MTDPMYTVDILVITSRGTIDYISDVTFNDINNYYPILRLTKPKDLQYIAYTSTVINR